MENYLMEKAYLYKEQDYIIRDILKWGEWMEREYKKHMNGVIKANFQMEIESSESSKIICSLTKGHFRIIKYQEREKSSLKTETFIADNF
jgi:hypothetical protein